MKSSEYLLNSLCPPHIKNLTCHSLEYDYSDEMMNKINHLLGAVKFGDISILEDPGARDMFSFEVYPEWADDHDGAPALSCGINEKGEWWMSAFLADPGDSCMASEYIVRFPSEGRTEDELFAAAEDLACAASI